MRSAGDELGRAQTRNRRSPIHNIIHALARQTGIRAWPLIRLLDRCREVTFALCNGDGDNEGKDGDEATRHAS